MPTRGEEGSLITWMRQTYRDRSAGAGDRPTGRMRMERLGQPAAERVIPHIRRNDERDAEPAPSQRRVAGGSPRAQFIMINKNLGARLRPRSSRPHDKVYVDIA